MHSTIINDHKDKDKHNDYRMTLQLTWMIVQMN